MPKVPTKRRTIYAMVRDCHMTIAGHPFGKCDRCRYQPRAVACIQWISFDKARVAAIAKAWHAYKARVEVVTEALLNSVAPDCAAWVRGRLARPESIHGYTREKLEREVE